MWRIYVVIFTVLFIVWLCLFRIHNFQYDKSNRSSDIYEESRKKVGHHIPKFMLELYDEVQSNPNITPPDVVKSVIPKKQGELNKEHNHLLLFEIPKTDTDEKLIEAELKILTMITENVEISNNNNILDHVVIVSVYNDVEHKLTPIERKHVVHKNNTWLSFNLTKTAGGAIEKNNLYLKLAISLKCFLPTLEGKLKLSLLPKDENYEHDYPILLLTYSLLRKDVVKRTKRNAEESEALDRRVKNSCRKRSLYVNFSEIYYDRWIVQPLGYEAFQCQGKCVYPMANHLSPTKHAIIQSLMHSLHPIRVSRICCVPTRLASISILYVEGGILTYRYAYRDMVVTECGCR